jgi:hypothetical protein
MSRIFISGSTRDFGLVAARLLLDTDPLHGSPHWLAQLPAQLTREHRATLQREILGAARECMVREIGNALDSITPEKGAESRGRLHRDSLGGANDGNGSCRSHRRELRTHDSSIQGQSVADNDWGEQ